MKVLNPTITVNESVVSADLDGETVLLNVETGVYFGLDPVGTEVWKVLEHGATEDDVIDHLKGMYEVAADQLRQDVGEFLAVLNDKGLIRTDPE